MCPWGLGYGRLGGWIPVLSVRAPNRQKTVLAVTRRHGRFFGFFWHIGTAFALRKILTLTTLMVGGFTEFFKEIAIYWFLEGFGHLKRDNSLW